jgi:hypothetical protein
MNWKTLLVVAAILALPHASLATDRDPPAVGAAKPACPMSIGERWEATDSLARRLPGFDQVGPTRPNKYVAIFYWTWHMGSGVDKARSQSGGSVANVSRIIAQYPTARNAYQHPAWQPYLGLNRFHWNEPLFGYYKTTDRWVLRRHAEMLADAGVDLVVFDCTNGTLTWKESYDVLGQVWTEARRDGVRTPKIAFLCPFAATDASRISITSIYEDLYKPKRFRELWFEWRGKPLLLGYPDNLPDEVRSFFTFRPGQPDYRRGPSRRDQWGWLEVSPQRGYVEYAPGRFEEVTVGVAQNATDQLAPAAMNDDSGRQVFGRSYTRAHGFDARPEAIHLGLNFQEQWDRALKIDPDLVFVTGWNEWVAGRYREWQGTSNAFPDQFTDEYSRDIEPSRGALGDAYYYQLVANIRRFKGVSPPLPASAPRTIVIDGKFDDWNGVRPEFQHHAGSTLHRNAPGYGQLVYTNATGRNDLVAARVARDVNNVYFYVETRNAITKPEGRHWMMLLVDADRDHATGWEGYDFVVNRLPPENGRAILEASSSGWNWQSVGRVALAHAGRRLELSIPRALLGLANKEAIDIELKWNDNLQTPGDIMDFYQSGDTAPGGRFNYRYRTKVSRLLGRVREPVGAP